MTFFGTTLKARPTRKWDVIDGLLFDTINFKFPSYSMRMLGLTNPPLCTVIEASRGKSFQLINSTFFGSDGMALRYSGKGVLLQNSLFEYNDWSVAIMTHKSGGFRTVISKGMKTSLFVIRYVSMAPAVVSVHREGIPLLS